MNKESGSSAPKPSVKIELIAVALLIPLVIVLGLALKRFPTSLSQSAVTPSPIGTVSPSPTILVAEDASASLKAVTPPQKASQTVTLTIHTSSKPAIYQIEVKGKTVVVDIMRQAEKQGLQLVTKDFGGSLGIFIESINGVKNNATPNYYWQFYINGQRSSLGISSATVSPHDRIEWKYENEN